MLVVLVLVNKTNIENYQSQDFQNVVCYFFHLEDLLNLARFFISIKINKIVQLFNILNKQYNEGLKILKARIYIQSFYDKRFLSYKLLKIKDNFQGCFLFLLENLGETWPFSNFANTPFKCFYFSRKLAEALYEKSMMLLLCGEPVIPLSRISCLLSVQM